MAIYKLYPSKDTTLYSFSPLSNSGRDSILEVSNYFILGEPNSCRILIKFPQNEINSIFTSLIQSNNYEVNLKLYRATVTGLNSDTKLFVFPIYGEWKMGDGTIGDEPKTYNGASWLYSQGENISPWLTGSYPQYVTGSYPINNIGGGNWYTGSSLGLNLEHTQSFYPYNSNDIQVDVTNTIKSWLSGSIPNEGFIIKQSNKYEFNPIISSESILKYFSIDTNTIYPPHLEFKWDDSIYSTGSSNLDILDSTQNLISLFNNKGQYLVDSVIKLRIAAIPKYPKRVYQTGSFYTTNNYLPSGSSYYAIKDVQTNEFIVNFDEHYTKISADEMSSYFNLYTKGFEPQRNYEVWLKTTINGETQITQTGEYFKIVN